MPEVRGLGILPLESVVEFHVSGLSKQSGSYWDDHAVPAPEPVLTLLEQRAPTRASTRCHARIQLVTALPSRTAARSAGAHASPPHVGMNAPRVHALIAAALKRPALLSRWTQQPEQLRVHGVTPGSLDLEGLRKFAGMTCKVRHNTLRASLPLSAVTDQVRARIAEALSVPQLALREAAARRLPQGSMMSSSRASPIPATSDEQRSCAGIPFACIDRYLFDHSRLN